MATAELKQDRLSSKTKSVAKSRSVMIVLAFAAIYLIWGSTYLAIRYAIETLPPFLMAATRFIIAGGILYCWAIIKGETVRQSISQWRRALVVGALLLLCGNGGVTWAEKYISSGLAALLVATEPLWVVILNWAVTHKRPTATILLGVLLGLPGVALLVGNGLSEGGPASSTMRLIGTAVVIVSGFAWASGSVYANRRPIAASTAMASAMQMLTGGLLLLLLGAVTGDLQRLNVSRVSWISIGALSYLIVFGSIVAFTAYSWLLRNVTPARAATYAYVNPVVAVVLGWLIAGEPITAWMLIGAAIIVGSVMLITTYSSHGAKSPATEANLHTSECPSHPCA
jgi:drug/metabolite transporter (DMT)-like permease